MNLTRIPVGLPVEQEAIPFEALAEFLANAVTPLPNAPDAEDLMFHLRLVEYDGRLRKAVAAGELVVRNPVTWDALPNYINLENTVVKVSDLKAYLERTGSVIEIVPLKEEQPLPAPVAWQGHIHQPGPDLLTPEEIDEAASWADAVNAAEDLERKERQEKSQQTWWGITSPYIVSVMKEYQCTTAKELFRKLEESAGNASPFEKGQGANRGALVVTSIGQTVALKTLQNKWGIIKAATFSKA